MKLVAETRSGKTEGGRTELPALHTELAFSESGGRGLCGRRSPPQAHDDPLEGVENLPSNRVTIRLLNLLFQKLVKKGSRNSDS